MGQYCFARWCLLSSSVTLPADGRDGRQARGRSAAAGPDAWIVGRPTLHGGPVRLRPVRVTPCSNFCPLVVRGTKIKIDQACHGRGNLPSATDYTVRISFQSNNSRHRFIKNVITDHEHEHPIAVY